MEIGFLTIVGIIFIILRVCKVIDWPWKWVLAPIWVPIVLTIVLWIGIFVLTLGTGAFLL